MTNSPAPSSGGRRDFLTGVTLRRLGRAAGDELANALTSGRPPERGPTLVLRTTAMACDFDVLLNPDGPDQQLEAASSALDRVHLIEQQLSVYRDDSDLADVNRFAGVRPVDVPPETLAVLQQAQTLEDQTAGAFCPRAGRLIQLWRRARREGRLPDDAELDQALQAVQQSRLLLDEAHRTAYLDHPEAALDLGAIGKGYAVDLAAEVMTTAGIESFLVHGGKSSVFAAGTHAGLPGWPVGLRDPLLPDRPFATLLLRDAALGTSGVAVQGFRIDGRRYGHIVDSRSGRPSEGMLSVSVIAPTSALADALSTAFFVMGVEKALTYCDNFPGVGAILFPLDSGTGRSPIFYNIPTDLLFPAGSTDR